MEAGEALEHRHPSPQRPAAHPRSRSSSRSRAHTEPVLTVGGDCGIALAPIAHAARRSPELAVVWIDAHPDLNTPDSSPSGAFSGMVLRAVLGDGEPALSIRAGHRRARPRRRRGGPLVRRRRARRGRRRSASRRCPSTTLRDPDALAAAVRATGADGVYIHVDVDALDPAELAGNAHPEPFGVTVGELTAAIAPLRAELPLVGSSLAGYSPASLSAARGRPRRDPADRRSPRVSPIPHAARRAGARRPSAPSSADARIDRFIPGFLLDSPISRAGFWYGSTVGWVWGSLWSTGRDREAGGTVDLPRDADAGRSRAAGRARADASSPATRRSATACCGTRPCTSGSGSATASSCRCCTCSPDAIRCAIASRSRPGSRTATTCRAARRAAGRLTLSCGSVARRGGVATSDAGARA